ncbi:hypothetical protein EcHS_A2790 [Escherichia coli HS]|nr:hypothetical protein EcHS_A2790 [Escherichia coli HS]
MSVKPVAIQLLLFVTIKKRSFETITDINCFTCYAWNF